MQSPSMLDFDFLVFFFSRFFFNFEMFFFSGGGGRWPQATTPLSRTCKGNVRKSQLHNCQRKSSISSLKCQSSWATKRFFRV